MSRSVLIILSILVMVPLAPAWSQQPPPAPAVGVVKVEKRPITQTDEFIGRIQAAATPNRAARSSWTARMARRIRRAARPRVNA